MSPRTKKQYKEIRQEKRDMILDTALEVFATHGFHGSSISMIAKHAGIAKGLLYNYFESKEELLREIFMIGFNEIDRIFDANKDGIITSDELEYFINEYCNLLINRTSFWKLYYTLMLQPAVMEIIAFEMHEQYSHIMLSKLTFYLKNSGVKDPEFETVLLHSLFDGIAMNYLMDPEDYPILKIKDFIIRKYVKK
jgi:AcrR family transcriptional regulator